ncbi:hypothetical protein EIN_074110 [Entamoeba invadens IP1]|uniref:Uncharacterized protein n=1 Tax=Entamoeba invadens IP1 TaxID=370355 RepID=A0A0A1UF41_ENTIV|nr:hypothetical protein EIN_074110 [Entamoeba invadens IP1]ELP92578.1 hypothetical protein EIN_074110 [Entamoeba invadens IP1]|eukprot:XP_004259349.1 hypothetical protein EIN_074110 [Entamoeba invadens IP1]
MSISLVVLFVITNKTCSSLPLTRTLDVFFEGTWVIADPLKGAMYHISIKPINGINGYIAKFSKPPPCFSQNYKLTFNNLHLNITTLSSQFITAVHFVNFKNTIVGKSVMILCGNVTEYTVTLLRSSTPTITISHRSTVNITRGYLVASKLLTDSPTDTFIQRHFLFILVILLFGLFFVVIYSFNLTFYSIQSLVTAIHGLKVECVEIHELVMSLLQRLLRKFPLNCSERGFYHLRLLI